MALIDYPYALTLTGGNSTILNMVIAHFIQQYEQDQFTALQAEPQDEAIRRFHTMKSLALSVGAKSLSLAASELENEAQTDGAPNQERLQSYNQLLNLTVQALRKHL